jgi:hypothetical protein
MAIVVGLAGQARAEQLKVLVRYDDYSAYSNLEVERRLFSEIAALGGGLIVGVIPFPGADYPIAASNVSPAQAILDTDKIALLSEQARAGRLEVAVHGYSHRNNAPKGLKSEFSVLPAELQSRLAADSRAALEHSLGAAVAAFIPPFNAYDDRTLQALQQAGYRLLSAGGSPTTLTNGDLNYLPGTTYPQNVRQVVEEALRRGHTDALVVPVLHPYDMAESGGEMPSFRKGGSSVSVDGLVNDMRSIARLPQVRLTSVQGLRAAGEDLSGARLLANALLRSSAIVRHRLVPQSLELYPVDGLYYSQRSVESIQARLFTAVVVVYGAAFVLGVFAGRAVVTWLGRRLGVRPRIVQAVAAIAVAAAAVAILWRVQSSGLYMNSAIALTLGAGALIGILAARGRPAARA